MTFGTTLVAREICQPEFLCLLKISHEDANRLIIRNAVYLPQYEIKEALQNPASPTQNVPSLEPLRVGLALADFCRQTLKTVVILATIVTLNDGFYCAKTLIWKNIRRKVYYKEVNKTKRKRLRETSFKKLLGTLLKLGISFLGSSGNCDIYHSLKKETGRCVHTDRIYLLLSECCTAEVLWFLTSRGWLTRNPVKKS